MGQVGPVNTRYFTILDTGTDMIMSKYLECFGIAVVRADFFMIIVYFFKNGNDSIMPLTSLHWQLSLYLINSFVI